MLPSHINRTVRLIGKVVQVSADGSRVQIEACDGGIVNIVRSMVPVRIRKFPVFDPRFFL